MSRETPHTFLDAFSLEDIAGFADMLYVDDFIVIWLNNHYEDLLRLAKLVLRNTFVDDLAPGDAAAYTLLLDMPDRYEAAVATMLEHAASEYFIETNAPLEDFITGDFKRNPEPDIILRTENNGPAVLVADSKWKSHDGKLSREDNYQMIAYQQYLDVPGVLLYPGGDDEAGVVSEAVVTNGHPLYTAKLPIEDPEDSLAAYRQKVAAVATHIISTATPSRSV